MEVWSFVNSKGGVGKSTLTVHIAHYLMSMGKQVCIVDADPQGSVRDWQEAGKVTQFSVVGLDRRQALKTLPFTINAEHFDYCLIDTPGRIAEIQAVAISLSDKIFIPVQPSCYDVWASSDVVEVIKSRQLALADTIGCPLAAFIINNTRQGTIIGRDVRESLLQFELPTMNQAITHRQSFKNTLSQGKTVISGKDKKARQELAVLVGELIDFA